MEDMEKKNFVLEAMTIRPIAISIYVPPIVWKGDCVGHIGQADTFFWVLEGECFLTVGSECAIVRPGQLAFLPKGKNRIYTHASDPFSMYEMAFSAEVNGGQNLMAVLGLTEHNFVVDIEEKDEMSALFEASHRKEMFKNPLYDVTWCANIVNIIRMYAEAHQRQTTDGRHDFLPVLEYMSRHLDAPVKTETLAALVYMQPTYFIRRFKASYGLPPQAYLARLRLSKAMSLLTSTGLPIEEIARTIGMEDTSYFARMFKKNCGITPSEYRKAFRKND